MSSDYILQLKRQLDYYQEVYNNTEEEIVSDVEFDAMVRCYEDLTGQEYKAIGAKPREDIVHLPRFCPSLDKIKDKNPERELMNFLSRYNANLLNLDKYDGVSLMIQYKDGKLTMYKRGDGVDGTDCSFIQNYLSFPQLPFDVLIRGELQMYENSLEEIKPYLTSKGNKATNTRSVVNGCTSRVDHDGFVISKCFFIPYSIYELPKNDKYGFSGEPILMSTQLALLKQWGFYVPDFPIFTKEQCTIPFLRQYLKKRREELNYRIDGTVLIFDIPCSYPEENKNPKHAVAIKEDLIKFTYIRGCNWNLTSKDGYMTPVIYVDPVTIITTVSEITLHNARIVYNNQLSEGDYIAVTQGGDIIPKFLWVQTPAANKVVFSPAIPYKWNVNSKGEGVEVMVLNPDLYPQVQCAKIKYFLSVLKIKKWGLLTIWKLYHSGLTNIGKIIRVTAQQLMGITEENEKSTTGVQEKGAAGLLEELQKGIKKATLPKIMAGSCIFGESIGEGIMEKFIKEFPSWKNIKVTYEEILSKKDFGPSRARIIADNLEAFKNWFNQIPELEGTFITAVVKNNTLAGYTFVFTGFTDIVTVQEIKSYGGNFLEKWRSDVNVVVAKDVNKSSDKQQHALNSGGKVKLISKIELDQMISNIRLTCN